MDSRGAYSYSKDCIVTKDACYHWLRSGNAPPIYVTGDYLDRKVPNVLHSSVRREGRTIVRHVSIGDDCFFRCVHFVQVGNGPKIAMHNQDVVRLLKSLNLPRPLHFQSDE